MPKKQAQKHTRKKNHQPVTRFLEASLLNYREAAARLGVSTSTLRGWVSAGKIDVVRFNHQVLRFQAEALDRFIAENTAEARQ